MKPFEARKRLGQGDPSSPYLFDLSMDYVPMCLCTHKDKKGFKYHPKRKTTDTTTLHI